MLQAAFKQGFRWEPAPFPVSPTPLDTLPVSEWANPKPIYAVDASPNYVPTGGTYEELGWDQPYPLGLNLPSVADTTPVPWSTGPVPSLQLSKTKRPVTRSKSKSTSRSQSRPKPTSTTQPATSRPAVVSNQPPAPFPRITVTPVTVSGVPGSSHQGIDTVSSVVSTNSSVSITTYLFIF